eukprot:CAMPEP_0172903378 /NCGR_PEP_ID=MMETSP1075-20121228/170412_1 /TAXON_ID=2916 /ORGANISM="Ceratium fusus, Strain PA161109" /LENGTH=55 /DNA_ID=CAMNT_0013760169 /DNA_START=333 /DNA_END=496 /DNA_ORIENTATION=+
MARVFATAPGNTFTSCGSGLSDAVIRQVFSACHLQWPWPLSTALLVCSQMQKWIA